MKIGPKFKTVYVFNLKGEIVYTGTTLDVMKQFSIPFGSMSNSIKRKSCCNKQFYFSHDHRFSVPKKKINHNYLKAKTTRSSSFATGGYFTILNDYFTSKENDLSFDC